MMVAAALRPLLLLLATGLRGGLTQHQPPLVRSPVSTPPRRLSISLYSAPTTNVTAANASFLHSVGVTDVWIPYMQGAFAVDCCHTNAYAAGGLHAGLLSLQQAKHDKLIETYAGAGIKSWFFERPVPDYEWTGQPGTIGPDMWNTSDKIDARWAEVVRNISTVYPEVKKMGFEGLVYDNEGYYSKTCNDPGPVSCLWNVDSAFDKVLDGKTVRGNYYKRGKQVGAAINAVWPGAKIIMVYGFPYPGLQQWVEGHLAGGVRVQIGTEHTYGAGPCKGPYYTGNWYQCAFETPAGPHHLSKTLEKEVKSWPPGTLQERMTAGIGPLGLGGYGPPAPQYESRYLQQQLHSALCDDKQGPLDVWLWLAAALTPDALAKINKTATEPNGAKDFTSLLYAYSGQNQNQTDLCATPAPL